MTTQTKTAHKFSIEPVGRTGLRGLFVCGKCGKAGEILKFGRWANAEFLRKRATECLRNCSCRTAVVS